MSWSISLVGTPSKVAEALKKHSENLNDQSKLEYEDALPHLVGIIEQNFAATTEPKVKITASGHGYAENGEQKQRQLVVSIEPFYGQSV